MARSKEHIYKRQHAAEAKVIDYMNKQTHEFVVCTHDAIHYIHPLIDSMTNATFNFLLDTLMHEIEMHPHRDELIQLIREQQEDDNSDTV